MAKYCFTNFAKCKVEPPMPNSSTVAVRPPTISITPSRSARHGEVIHGLLGSWLCGLHCARSFGASSRTIGRRVALKTGNERSASNSKLITSFRTFGFMRQVCGFEFTGAQLFDLRWVNLQRAVTTHFLASSSARYPRTCVPCCENLPKFAKGKNTRKYTRE